VAQLAASRRSLLAVPPSEPAVGLNLAKAKCRLFPELDRVKIYREYGISSDEYG